VSNMVKSHEEFICRIIDEQFQNKCREFARANRISENILCESAWGAFLQMVGQSNDVVYHIVHAGRPHLFDGVEKMVGCFIKTIPIRVTHLKNSTFYECINELYQNFKNINEVINETASDMMPSNVSKVENLFIYENYPDATIESKSNFSIKDFNVYSPIPVELFMIVIARPSKVKFELHYRESSYTNEMVTEILEQYLSFFKILIAHPDKNMSDLYNESFLPIKHDEGQFDFNF